MDRVHAAGDKRGVTALGRIGADPSRWDAAAWGVKMQWAMKTDPVSPNAMKLIFKLLLTSPEYTLRDARDWLAGFGPVRDHLFTQFIAYDARRGGTTFELPVYLFPGDQDVITLTSLAQEYDAEMYAPAKGLALIPNASHFCAFTQPEEFLAALSSTSDGPNRGHRCRGASDRRQVPVRLVAVTWSPRHRARGGAPRRRGTRAPNRRYQRTATTIASGGTGIWRTPTAIVTACARSRASPVKPARTVERSTQQTRTTARGWRRSTRAAVLATPITGHLSPTTGTCANWRDLLRRSCRRAATVGRQERGTMRRFRAWAGLIGSVIGAAAFLAMFARWQGQFDLHVYRGAVRSWLHGDGLYTYRQPGTIRSFGFTYPPFAALVLMPLAVLPWRVAEMLLVLAALSGTLILLWHRLRALLPVLTGAVLVAATEPWRDTITLGQINLVLLTLVGLDLLFVLKRHPAAGALIGIAAGIKLTPALFIVYLVLTRRHRAGLVGGSTALLTAGLGWLFAPDDSRRYWTHLLWQTDRIGDVTIVGNQSLSGAVHRLHTAPGVWPALVAVVLVVWAFRVRKAGALPDDWAGLSLTGVAICLVSPFTWVHHLVWQLPALLVLLDSRAAGRRRHWFRLLAVVVYAVMVTSLEWRFQDPGTLGYQLGSNIQVITGLILLTAVPVNITTANVPVPSRSNAAASMAHSLQR
jgi:alpha-1,2-mannosyltransferase